MCNHSPTEPVPEYLSRAQLATRWRISLANLKSWEKESPISRFSEGRHHRVSYPLAEILEIEKEGTQPEAVSRLEISTSLYERLESLHTDSQINSFPTLLKEAAQTVENLYASDYVLAALRVPSGELLSGRNTARRVEIKTKLTSEVSARLAQHDCLTGDAVRRTGYANMFEDHLEAALRKLISSQNVAACPVCNPAPALESDRNPSTACCAENSPQVAAGPWKIRQHLDKNLF